MLKQDILIRKWTKRVWSNNDETARLALINKFELPYKAEFLKTFRAAMKDAWRFGRDRAMRNTNLMNGIGKWFKGEILDVQEFLIAEVQELDGSELFFTKVAKKYDEWADTVGDSLWERKITAVKGTMVTGIQNGWTLQPQTHYEKAGERVSASEATGPEGGMENILPGYKFVQDKPGLLTEMSKKLAPFGLQGWEINRIANTEHTRAFNEGLLSVYLEDDAVVAFEVSEVIDFKVCSECAMINGMVFDRNDSRLQWYTPPIHPNCRGELYPVMAWEMRDSTIDVERTVKLYDRDGKGFDVTFTPNRVNPEFLKTIRQSKDEAGIKRQLMTADQANSYRGDYTPRTPQERFSEWMYPNNESKQSDVEDLMEGV